MPIKATNHKLPTTACDALLRLDVVAALALIPAAPAVLEVVLPVTLGEPDEATCAPAEAVCDVVVAAALLDDVTTSVEAV